MLFCLAWIAGASPEALVVLGEPRVQLFADETPARLRIEVSAESSAPLGVTELELGVLFAASADAIASAPAAVLYEAGSTDGVGVWRRRVAANITPGGSSVVSWSGAAPAGAPQPRAFAMHVLSYRLAQVSADALLSIVAAGTAADELSAVQHLGLHGNKRRRQAIRDSLGADAALISGLAACANADIVARPDERETVRRLYCVRALGVLGGAGALTALTQLQQNSGLAGFDEPLQVLRTARLTSSRLEAPMAYLVPGKAVHMRGVVKAAINELGGWGEIAPTELPAPEPSGEPEELDVFDPPYAKNRAYGWWAGALGLLILAVVWGVRRASRAQN